MEKVKYVTYKVLIARERATSVFEDMITIPENKPYSEIPAFISAYVRTQLENKMLTEEERAEIHNENKTYEQGLADAWEAARKIASIDKKVGLASYELYNIFGTTFVTEIFNAYTPAEVIAKIKAYEDIKVGDEIISNIGNKAVITKVTENEFYFMFFDGSNKVLYKSDFPLIYKKTGKHYPQVEELLKMMKEGQ